MKDLKRVKKRGKDIDKIELIVNLLQNKTPLTARSKDYNLAGNWKDHRECHIEPDWLLIYQTSDQFLILERTGSHSDLFE